MAHCINTNSPEYKNLENAVKASIPTDLLKATIAVWQEKNGLENWPTLQDLSVLINKPNFVNIKQGVPELFDSNPELANSVYEALGFDTIGEEVHGLMFTDLTTDKKHDVINTLTTGKRELLPSSVLLKELLNSKYLPEINKFDIRLGLNESSVFNAENKEIIVNGSSLNSIAKNLNHELLHSITHDILISYEIENGLIDLKDKSWSEAIEKGYIKQIELSAEQKKALFELSKIKDVVIKYIQDGNYENNENIRYFIDEEIRRYGEFSSIDLHEFVSEVFTNKELVSLMKKIPSTNKKESNIFKVFLNRISDLLGIRNYSIFEEAIANAEIAFFEHKPQISSEQKQQAQQLYSKYLDTIFPDSKVKDIVYHGSNEKRDILDPTKQIRSKFGKGISFAPTISLVKQLIDNPVIHAAIIDLKNPLTDIPIKSSEVQSAVEVGNHDGVQVGKMEYTVPTKEQIHILGSKQDIERFKKFVTHLEIQEAREISYSLDNASGVNNEKEYNNQINYRLKATKTVLDNLTKIKQWESNKSIDKNTLWRKIGELGIPKQQLELLKESDDNTIEEKLTSFIANYSYTVEINTAKEKYIDYIKDVEEFTGHENEYEIEKEVNTQHYSNLTVPGGTNYTENEIVTPAIAPSIKGHAQFSTNNGIGWFRSDEKEKGNIELITDKSQIPIKQFKVGNTIFFTYDNGKSWMGEREDGTPFNISDKEIVDNWNKLYNKTNEGSTGTRRILEIQSDLFQKGRDKKDLLQTIQTRPDVTDKTVLDIINKKIEEDETGFGIGNEITIDGVTYERNPSNGKWRYKEFQNVRGDEQQNQFLQLLNKDNNWVTFFVKSIIQDSAKKGYEKVLFPSGNTASRIEGHSTLEDFKREKEGRLKELEKIKSIRRKAIDEFSNGKKTREEVDGKDGYFINIEKANGGNWSVYVNNKVEEDIAIQEELSNLNSSYIEPDNEINQLKQELERVETEGFGALKPIYNFYENTITNILKKQGYNPNLITDEYGNIWNEINIKQVRDLREISFSLDDIAGVNYQDIDFDAIDVDAALASAGIEEGSSPEKTRRFGVIEKALYHNINQINNRIFRLKDRIRKARPGIIKNNLTKQLVILEEQLEKYQQQKDEYKDVQQIERLRKYAEQDIERVKEILNQPNISSEDIQEARRLVGLWSSIGDFTPSMAENHPLFTAEELQMDSLKYGFDMEDGTHVKGFAEYKNEIDRLGADIEGIAREEVVRFVRNTLKDQTIDKETVFKVLKDLQLPATYLMSLGRVPDVLAQAIAASFRKIEAESIRETQERIDRLDALYKKIKKKLANNIELFQQKFKNGQLTGGIVDRIAPEFSEERDDLYSEARADKSGAKWQDYFNWIKQNTIYFDVRKLFDQAGNPILDSEAEAHKEELIKHLGEKGFEVYYDKQRRRIDGYFQAKAAFEAALEEKKDLSAGQKIIALRNWEAINSPYIALDRILDNKVINVDGKPVKSRNNYNLYVPRKFRTDGSLTGYYDANYQTIESDADLFAYYEEVVNTLSEVRSYLPEEERRKLQTNSLPYIINSMIGTYNADGLKLGAAAISKIVQKLYTQTDQSEIEFGEEDLSTHSINNTARMAFRDRTNKMVNIRLQTQIAEYVKQNQSPPTRDTVLKWRRAIKDELAKEKSWDINNVMKLYITSAMAYKHKSAASSILNLAQVALLQKGGIKSPGDARSIDIYGEPLTQQSIKNLSELLAYTSDVFYGMPKHAIEGKITQVVVKGYEAEFKKLNDAMKTNQDNYDKGLISETQYSRNKKTFERELKTLQTNISVSSLADGFLKYGQVVGMGYNVIAGVVNLMVGSLENATRSADAGLLSPKALSLAYKDVIQIIGNKSTPIGKKVINLNKKLNITKTAQNELYDNTSEFWKKFRAFSPFKITEKTEMVNQLPLAFALMRSKTSYNDKGEEISMWEAFDNDGNVKIGYTLSKEMSNEDAISQYQLQVSELINQTHGNYDISSPILAKKFIMGRLGMQFRTWMPEMAMRRWGAERDDKILGIKTKGRWRSYRAVWEATVDSENPDISYTKLENALYASKMLIRKILFIPQYKYALDPKGNKVSYKEAYDKNGRLKNGYKPIRAFDTRMSELDARNMRANLIEVALLIQMYLTKLLILAVMPDLDDDKKRVAIGMLNIGKRLRSDILMFANPVEYEKLNKNLLPISQYLKHIGSWGYDASKFLVSWDDDSWRDLVKQTGIITPGFSQARRVITYTDRQFTNN